jgi:hypothetical protein
MGVLVLRAWRARGGGRCCRERVSGAGHALGALTSTVPARLAGLTRVIVCTGTIHVHDCEKRFVLPSLVKGVFAVHKAHSVEAWLELEAAALELELVREKGADGLTVHFDVHGEGVTKLHCGSGKSVTHMPSYGTSASTRWMYTTRPAVTISTCSSSTLSMPSPVSPLLTKAPAPCQPLQLSGVEGESSLRARQYVLKGTGSRSAGQLSQRLPPPSENVPAPHELENRRRVRGIGGK